MGSTTCKTRRCESARSGTGRQAFFQAKLSINQENDVYEQEADHIADNVMRMGDNAIGQKSFFKPSAIQRKCSAGNEGVSSSDVDSYVGSLNSSGRPLSENSRKFFEPKFGRDFSDVKLHTDPSAAKSAQAINALAYTSGNNIVFNTAQYSPDSEKGKKLLAHELTHVVQQNSGATPAVQRMLACPTHLDDSDPVPPGFKPYFGSTSVFHCGFRTILEDRAPTPDDPMNECVYDHSGTLVTDSHPNAGCQGTPDQYDSKSHPIKHAVLDSGGIVRAGGPALLSSMGHAAGEAVDAVTQPIRDAGSWLERGVRGLYGM